MYAHHFECVRLTMFWCGVVVGQVQEGAGRRRGATCWTSLFPSSFHRLRAFSMYWALRAVDTGTKALSDEVSVTEGSFSGSYDSSALLVAWTGGDSAVLELGIRGGKLTMFLRGGEGGGQHRHLDSAWCVKWYTTRLAYLGMKITAKQNTTARKTAGFCRELRSVDGVFTQTRRVLFWEERWGHTICHHIVVLVGYVPEARANWTRFREGGMHVPEARATCNSGHM